MRSGDGDALEFARGGAELKDDVAFTLHGLTNDARPILERLARETFVIFFVFVFLVFFVSVSFVVRSRGFLRRERVASGLRRALGVSARRASTHLAQYDV